MRTLALALGFLIALSAIAYANGGPPNPPPFQQDCCCEEQCVKAIPVKGWLVLVDTCEGTLERVRLKDIHERGGQ